MHVLAAVMTRAPGEAGVGDGPSLVGSVLRAAQASRSFLSAEHPAICLSQVHGTYVQPFAAGSAGVPYRAARAKANQSDPWA